MKMIFINFNSSCSCNVYSDVSKGFTLRMLFDRILGSMNTLRLQFTPDFIKINSMNFRRTLLLILLACLLTSPAIAQFDDEIPEEGSLLVPLDAWNTVLNQLGNLHEASQQMAEARERAAKAESEADFLREKLKNTRQQLEEVTKKKRFFFF